MPDEKQDNKPKAPNVTDIAGRRPDWLKSDAYKRIFGRRLEAAGKVEPLPEGPETRHIVPEIPWVDPQIDWYRLAARELYRQEERLGPLVSEFQVDPSKYGLEAPVFNEHPMALIPYSRLGYQPSYWEDPYRVARWYNLIQSSPPGWQAPEWLDTGAITAAYRYMQKRNEGKPWTSWKFLDPEDPARGFLQQIGMPPKEALLPQEIIYSPTPSDERQTQPVEMYADPTEDPNWDKLSWWQKAARSTIASGSPWGQALGGAIIGGVGGALGGAIFGGVGAIPGAIVGALKGGALGGVLLGGALGYGHASLAQYLQEHPEELEEGGPAATAYKIMVPAMQFFNLAWEGLIKRPAGLVLQAGGSIADPERYGPLDELMSDLPAAWKAGALTATAAPVELANIPQAIGAPFTEREERFASPLKDATVWTVFDPEPQPLVDLEGLDGDVLRGVDWIDSLVWARRQIAEGAPTEAVVNLVTARYGFSGQARELFGAIILDPGVHVFPRGATRLLGTIGSMTGNDALASAAQIARGLKRGGGPISTLRLYGTLLRTEQPVDVVASGSFLTRFLGGVETTAEGEPLPVTLIPRNGLLNHLFGLTPRAQATEVLGITADTAKALIDYHGDPLEVAQVWRNLAETPIQVGEDLSLRFIGTPHGAYLIQALKDFDFEKLSNMEAGWRATEVPRTILNQLSKLTGKHQIEILQALEDAEKMRPWFEDIIRQAETRAAEGDAVAAQLVEAARAGQFTEGTLQSMFKLFVKEQAPWHPEMWKAQLYDAWMDHVADWTIKRLGVRVEPLVWRLSKVAKSAQSLLLLDINPHYAINNFVNNMGTAIVDGTFKMRTIKQSLGWWDQLGVFPYKLRQAYGGPAQLDPEAANMAIRLNEQAAAEMGFQNLGIKSEQEAFTKIVDAATGKGGLRVAQDWLGRVRRKVGVATRFSAKVEEWSSVQATTEGAQQMWAQLWLPGKGMSRMPPVLEQALGPELSNAIYGVVTGSLRMEQVTDALVESATLRKPIEAYIGEVSQALGMDAEQVGEIMVRSGAVDFLREHLPKAQSEVEVREAFTLMRQHVQSHLDDLAAEEYVSRTMHTAAQVQSGDWTGFLDNWFNLQRQKDDWWTSHTLKWSEAMDEVAAIDDQEIANQIVSARMFEANQEATRMQRIERATIRGIAEGLERKGIDVPEDYTGALEQMHDALLTFFTLRDDEWRNFWRQVQDGLLEGKDFRDEYVRISRMLDNEYGKIALDMNNLQEMMDDAVVEMVAQTNPELADSLGVMLGELREHRLLMMANEQNIRRLQTRVRTFGITTGKALADAIEEQFQGQPEFLERIKPWLRQLRKEGKITSTYDINHRLYNEYVNNMKVPAIAEQETIRQQGLGRVFAGDEEVKPPTEQEAVEEVRPAPEPDEITRVTEQVEGLADVLKGQVPSEQLLEASAGEIIHDTMPAEMIGVLHKALGIEPNEHGKAAGWLDQAYKRFHPKYKSPLDLIEKVDTQALNELRSAANDARIPTLSRTGAKLDNRLVNWINSGGGLGLSNEGLPIRRLDELDTEQLSQVMEILRARAESYDALEEYGKTVGLNFEAMKFLDDHKASLPQARRIAVANGLHDELASRMEKQEVYDWLWARRGGRPYEWPEQNYMTPNRFRDLMRTFVKDHEEADQMIDVLVRMEELKAQANDMSLEDWLALNYAPDDSISQQALYQRVGVDHPWVKAAVNTFGRTESPLQGLYLLRDGTFLDGSSRALGSDYPSRGRVVDHREIGRAIWDENGKRVPGTEGMMGGTEGLWEFVHRTGSVRWSMLRAEKGIRPWIKADIGGRPSTDQLITILTAARGADLDIHAYRSGEDAPIRSWSVDNASVEDINRILAEVEETYPSTLYQQPAELIQQPEFRQWFEGGQVVDAEGLPRMLYHTPHPDFEGIYFLTDDPLYAKGSYQEAVRWTYHGEMEAARDQPGRVGPYWRDTASRDWIAPVRDYRMRREGVADSAAPVFVNSKNILELGRMLDPQEIQQIEAIAAQAMQAGYDGIRHEGGYIVFDPANIKSAHGASDWSHPSNLLFQEPERAPIFYSKLRRAVDEKMQDTMPADDAANWIKKQGIKKDELHWTGVLDFLEAKAEAGEQVTKAEVLEWLDDNQVELRPVVYPGLRWEWSPYEPLERIGVTWEQVAPATWQALRADGELAGRVEKWSPGQYSAFYGGPESISFGIFDTFDEAQYALMKAKKPERIDVQYERYTLPGGEDYQEHLLLLPVDEEAPTGPFNSGHWKDKNVLAHTRTNIRTDPEGGKIYFIEELQSDWHQRGRESGYAEPVARAAIEEAEDRFVDLNRRIQEEIGLDRPWVDQGSVAYYKDRKRISPYTIIESYGEYIAKGELGQYARGPDPESVRAIMAEMSERGFIPTAEAQGVEIVRRVNHHAYEVSPEQWELITDHRLRFSEWQTLEMAARGGGVPEAPWKKDWHELSMRYMLRRAAENGQSRLAWTTGETQVERWKLGNYVDRIEWKEIGENRINIRARKGEGLVFDRTFHDPDDASQYVGRDLASQMWGALEERGPWEQGMEELSGTFEGEDLYVGQRGMQFFYDTLLPRYMNKYLKRYGGEVYKGQVRAGDGYTVYRVVRRGARWGLSDVKDAHTKGIYLDRESAEAALEPDFMIVEEQHEGMPRIATSRYLADPDAGEWQHNVFIDVPGSTTWKITEGIETEAAARLLAEEFTNELYKPAYEEAWMVDIPDELRASVLYEGQRLFQIPFDQGLKERRFRAIDALREQGMELGQIEDLMRTRNLGELEGDSLAIAQELIEANDQLRFLGRTGGKYTFGDHVMWLRRTLGEDFKVAVREVEGRMPYLGEEARRGYQLYETSSGTVLASFTDEVTADVAARVLNEGGVIQSGQTQPKGSYQLMGDGRALIKAITDPDFSTAIHEATHVLRRRLDQTDMQIALRWYQEEYGGEVDLMSDGVTVMGQHADDFEEKFARGFERYLAEGVAPTDALKAIFEKIKTWLLEVYEAIQGSEIDVKITDEMRDLYARNISGDPEIREMVGNYYSTRPLDLPVKDVPEPETVSVNAEPVRRVSFDQWAMQRKNELEAAAEIDNAAERIDAINEMLRSSREMAEDPSWVDRVSKSLENEILARAQGELRAAEGIEGATGGVSRAHGPDPNEWYEFQYRVMSLDDLIASHNQEGRLNSEYPQSLQARDRGRAASRLQFERIASELEPQALIYRSQRLDDGSPIVGPDAVVESGNGRVNALRMAADDFPENYDRYKQTLLETLESDESYGFTEEALQAAREIERPILVRERVSDVDRAEFASVANKSAILGMSHSETAISDAELITDAGMAGLEIGESQKIEAALRSPRNRSFTEGFMARLPENDQAMMVDESGELSRIGIDRIVAALYARTFGGEIGKRLIQLKYESLDLAVKRIINGIDGALPELARAEGMIRAGRRPEELSISTDLAEAVVKLQYLKENRIAIEDYVNQQQMWQDLTEFQQALLVDLAEARSAKQIREPLQRFGRRIQDLPDVDQSGMWGEYEYPTKQDTWAAAKEEPQAQLFQLPRGEELGGIDAVPEPLYMASSQQEAWDNIQPVLRALEQRMASPEEFNKVWTREELNRTLSDPEMQEQFVSWLNSLRGDMASTKYTAMKWGEAMRDWTLLDYQARRGVDNYLEGAIPYFFWPSRTLLRWALRSIDKPSLMGNYYRLMKLQSQYQPPAGFPTRLKGKWRIPMPFLPEWMNGGMWVDPLRSWFPPAMFVSNFARIGEQKEQEISKAETVISQWAAQGEVSQQEAQQAVDTRDGKVWQEALEVARSELSSDFTGPLDYLGILSSFSLPLEWARQYQRGTPENIGALPMTRTIKNITAPLGIGGPGGINIERPIRRRLDLPDFDKYEDYRVERMISNMIAEGVVDPRQGEIAQMEHRGPVWDEATRRVNQARFRGRYANPLFWLGFPADSFPEGEAAQRALGEEWGRAMESYKQGDREALRNMLEEYPEYESRLALWNDPKERLRFFLVDEIWTKYMELDSANKEQVRLQLGEEFQRLFLDKPPAGESRNYEAIPVPMLAAWARAVGGYLPDMPERENGYDLPQEDVQTIREGPQVRLLPPAISEEISTYRDMRSSKFPNWFAVQQGYFDEAPGEARRQYLRENPMLEEYWDWNRQYKKDHPNVAIYSDRYKLQNGDDEVIAEFRVPEILSNPTLMRQLLSYRMSGVPLTSGALAELRRIWESMGAPGPDLQYFMDELSLQ